ncbi:hypothetical protein IEO21_06614 [Rhodonia placenta]|uniref:Yeast cell wall synthesis Kre9/Knh1-like N-terminal domain-containing protein n=1 Tax=Rhodonia placenta TaxID=104341 RepID=A0A8H7NZM6_9APHY|nr:hypothetical protein IEO21_06614 [Postia placenta]
MFSRAFVALALTATIPATLANVYVTSPVKGTTWPAGQNQTISWEESGAAPTLDAFGLADVSIYVGNQIQQTSVQAIATNVNVSSTKSIIFTPNPSAGESGTFYFVRFESTTAKDPNNTAYPAEAFSATFALSGMTGTFTAEEQSQINGALSSSAAVSPSTAAASSSPLANSAATHSASSSASASQSAAAGAANTNGARSLATGSLGAFAGIALAVVGAMVL